MFKIDIKNFAINQNKLTIDIQSKSQNKDNYGLLFYDLKLTKINNDCEETIAADN